AVNEAHFVGSEIRRVRTKQKEFALSSRRENFQVKLRARIGDLLPGEADLPGLFAQRHLSRPAEDNGAGLELDCGIQDAAPQVIGRDDSQTNRLAALFRDR